MDVCADHMWRHPPGTTTMGIDRLALASLLRSRSEWVRGCTLGIMCHLPRRFGHFDIRRLVVISTGFCRPIPARDPWRKFTPAEGRWSKSIS
jgi:hypothetical protein